MKAKKKPKLRRQRHGGARPDRAFVEIQGTRFYLGEWGTRASQREYRRLMVQLATAGTDELMPVVDRPVKVVEICARFLLHAKTYYRRPDGTRTSELATFKSILRSLRDLYGNKLGKEFGPQMLRVVRQRFVDDGMARSTANSYTRRVRQIFRWAASMELVPVTVPQALSTVEPLKRGRCDVRETEPVRPVPQAHVDAIEPFVSRQVWALVELQLLTGARPSELLGLRACDLDMTGEIWESRPREHKTAYLGRSRTIYFGPKAQAVIRPFLEDRALNATLFSASEAEKERQARRNAARVTPESCGNRPGTNRSKRPKRKPGAEYRVDSYRKAIEKGCRKAKVPVWTPYRLRHNAATELRKQFGVEVSRIILGHSQVATTEIYAEADQKLALRAIASFG